MLIISKLVEQSMFTPLFFIMNIKGAVQFSALEQKDISEPSFPCKPTPKIKLLDLKPKMKMESPMA